MVEVNENLKAYKVTLMGLLTPSNWNSDNSIASVLLSAEDEYNYKIKPENMEHELIRYVNKRIKAQGLIVIGPNQKRVFIVDSYKIIDFKKMEEMSL